jgi:uncharacterized protein YjbI with pentapeptide repeats
MGRGFRIAVCSLLVVCASVAFAGVAGATKKPNPDPGVPTGLKAVARYTSLTLSWNQPSSTGAGPITTYRLAGNLGRPASSCESLATSCLVSGLKPGKKYTVQVRAYNSVGDRGPFTKPINVKVGIPDPPTGVAGQSSNASTLVSWTPPALNPHVVTGYTVSADPGGQTCTTVVSSSSPTACTVDGLTNGTAYTFTATSKDVYGVSVSSAPSSPVVPMTVPEAPIDVVATGYQNTQASVSWTPSDDGGSTPTFTVTSVPAGGSCETVAITCTVSGLTNGQGYTFTVIATNVVGAGPASLPSSPVTPSAAPGAPMDVEVTSPASGSATVTWSAPAYDGGNPVASYQVSASPGGAACTSDDLSSLSCTVSGLSSTTAYAFWVTATNPSGTGPGGYASLFVPGCTPAPQSDLAGCNFTDLNLTGVDFDGSDLANANFTDANLSDGNLTDANLTYVNFTGATLDGANLAGASLYLNNKGYGGMSGVGTTFPVGFEVVDGYLVGPSADISGVDFAGGDFTGATLNSDVLDNDNFSGADLSGLDLDRSDLTGSNLTNANLTDANLTYVTFTGVTLDGANLTGASLDINGNTYSGMSAVGTTFPAGFAVVDGYLVGPGANISGVDFAGGDFTGATLSSDVLDNDDFSGADLSGVDLDRSDLTGSNLTDADLTNADLTNANLNNVILVGAVFDDTVCPDGTNSSSDNGTCLNNL